MIDRDPQRIKIDREVVQREPDPLSVLPSSLNARIRALQGDLTYFDPKKKLPEVVDIQSLPSSAHLVYSAIQTDWNEKRKGVTDTVEQWGKRAAKTTLQLFEEHMGDASNILLLRAAFHNWGVSIVTDSKDTSFKEQFKDVADAFGSEFFNRYAGDKPNISVQRLGQDLVKSVIYALGFQDDTMQLIGTSEAHVIASSVTKLKDLLQGWLGKYFQDSENLARFNLCVDADVTSIFRHVYENNVLTDQLKPTEVVLFDNIAPKFAIVTTPLPVVEPIKSQQLEQPLNDSTNGGVESAGKIGTPFTAYADRILSPDRIQREVGLTEDVNDYLAYRQHFFELIKQLRESQQNNWTKLSDSHQNNMIVDRLGLKGNISPSLIQIFNEKIISPQEMRIDDVSQIVRQFYKHKKRDPLNEDEILQLEANAIGLTRDKFLKDLLRIGISYKEILGEKVNSNQLALPLTDQMIKGIVQRVSEVIHELTDEGVEFGTISSPSEITNLLAWDILLADQLYHLYRVFPLEYTARIIRDREDVKRQQAVQKQAIGEYMAIRSDIFSLMDELTESISGYGKYDEFQAHNKRLASSLDVSENVMSDIVNQLREAPTEERIAILDKFFEYTNFPYRSHVEAMKGFNGNFVNAVRSDTREQWATFSKQHGMFDTYGFQEVTLTQLEPIQIEHVLTLLMGNAFYESKGMEILNRIDNLPTLEDQLYALMHVPAPVTEVSRRKQREVKSNREWDDTAELAPPPIQKNWML